MNNRIAEYTVGELASLSGVSIRTLHHYDAIGLLRPAAVGSNGYRIYTRTEALRLQEILAYRAVGLGLTQIEELLSAQSDPVERLIAHRDQLHSRAKELAQMITALDAAIAERTGEIQMADKDLYTQFSPKVQSGHVDWLVDTYGPEMRKSIEHANLHAPDHAAAMERLALIEAKLVAAFDAGQDAAEPSVDPILEAHRDWVASMWGRPCPPVAYEGLSKMYLAHPGFVARYEQLSTGFSNWLPRAMAAHAQRHSG